MTCFTVIVFQIDPPIDRFWPITSQLSYEHTSFGILVYVYISLLFFSGGLPIPIDPSRSIFIHYLLFIHLFLARQPPYSYFYNFHFLGNNCGSCIHVFIFVCCLSLVLFDPWSVPGLHHTQFMKTRPKDADSSRYVYLSWLLLGFTTVYLCLAQSWSVGSYFIDCWAPCFRCCSSWT